MPPYRRILVALTAGAGLAAGTWALHAAPGMPAAAPGSTPGQAALRALVARLEGQSVLSEQQVLQQANTQGTAEIAALHAAQSGLARTQAQLATAVGAEAAYRQAALQATARAQQLAAELQAQTARARRGDDGGGDG